MKDKKRRLELYSFYDHTGIERHLEAMAYQGWLLEKIGFLWTYRRVEPRRLTFSVCYFPKASAYDPEPSQEQETFYDFCAHTGWTLAAANGQMQIFYNERENPTPIETDPALEVEAIHKSAKKSVLPSYISLLAVGVLNAALQLWQLLDDPIWFLSNASLLFAASAWVMVFLTCGVELATYYRWRRRAVRAAERGEFLPTHSHVLFQTVMLWLVSFNAVYWLASISPRLASVGVAALVFLIALVGLTRGLTQLLKRRKVSAKVNQAVTLAACLVLTLAFTGGLVFHTIHSLRQGRGETYTALGGAWTAYHDTLPLTVEELTGQESGDYVYEIRSSSQSRLLARTEAVQHPRFDSPDYTTLPSLEYTVLTPRLAFLYDFWYGLYRDCLLDQWKDRPYWADRAYAPIDPAPWGAAEAYQLTSGEHGPWDRYLLCYPYHIVEIDFDWTPTAEQMAIVGRTFGGR